MKKFTSFYVCNMYLQYSRYVNLIVSIPKKRQTNYIDPIFHDWVYFEVPKRLDLWFYLANTLLFCSPRCLHFKTINHMFSLSFKAVIGKYLHRFLRGSMVLIGPNILLDLTWPQENFQGSQNLYCLKKFRLKFKNVKNRKIC